MWRQGLWFVMGKRDGGQECEHFAGRSQLLETETHWLLKRELDPESANRESRGEENGRSVVHCWDVNKDSQIDTYGVDRG